MRTTFPSVPSIDPVIEPPWIKMEWNCGSTGESYVLSVTSKVYYLYCNVTSEILIVENLFREAAYRLG